MLTVFNASKVGAAWLFISFLEILKDLYILRGGNPL